MPIFNNFRQFLDNNRSLILFVIKRTDEKICSKHKQHFLSERIVSQFIATKNEKAERKKAEKDGKKNRGSYYAPFRSRGMEKK